MGAPIPDVSRSEDAVLSVLLVGTGGMGAHWLEALAPGAAPACVALGAVFTPGGPLPEALPEGVFVAPDIETAIARRPDVVIDTSSVNARLSVTAPLVRAGCALLCEPPLARDADIAAHLIGLAARAGTTLAMAQRLRFDAGLRGLARSGPEAQVTLTAFVSPAGHAPWRSRAAAILDVLDAGRAVLNSNARFVTCRSESAAGGDGFHARFEMDSGAEFVCSTRDVASPVFQFGRTSLTVGDRTGAAMPALEALRHALATDTTPLTAGRDNARSLAMLLTMRESARCAGARLPVHDISLAGDTGDFGLMRARGDG